MTELLNNVKADLLDRRLLPIIALVGVALLAALAYVVLGGGSTEATSTPASAGASTSVPNAGGLVVSQSQADASAPTAETTNGSSAQHGGPARNPFTPLPTPKIASLSATTVSKSPATAAAGSSTASTGSGAAASPPSSKEPTPAAPPKPAPSKPATVYHVAVLFGVLPAGTSPANAQLTPYENLRLLAPLPSSKQALVVFRGVTAASKSATFTLVSEAILHGSAICLPTASQCQEIDLKAGQSEQLEYLNSSGETVTYELRVVSITSGNATSASLKSVLHSESTVGRELLRQAGLIQLPNLRYSQAGVLVVAHASRSGARGHAAGRSSRRKG